MSERGQVSSLISITLLRSRLLDLIDEPPTYRSIYIAAIDGLIPAHWVRGRWFVDEADLSEVARILKARSRPQGRGAPRAAADIAA